MFELDKASFARFLAELRKAKGYTQKELAEKLYVSDKAISKWERGLSMPDISLLIPLAEILEVSVTELLEGRRLEPGSEMSAGKVEELVKKALVLSEDTPESRMLRKERLRKNAFTFFGCAIFMILETLAGILLLKDGFAEAASPTVFSASLGGTISMLVLEGLGFCFGIYLWFFIKERLPNYYDENKICVYQDGFFNLSLPGISFNNGSWPQMVKALRAWSAITMVTAPPVCLLPLLFCGLFPASWLPFCLQMILMSLYIAGMFVPLYVINGKYEKMHPAAPIVQTAEAAGGLRTPEADTDLAQAKKRKKTALLIFMAVMLVLALLIIFACRTVGVTRSGIRRGYTTHYTMQEWSASYRLFNGTLQKTIYPASGVDTYLLETETVQGSLSVEMTDRSGNVVFSAADLPSGSTEVPMSGTTRVKITGKDHKGSFSLCPLPAE